MPLDQANLDTPPAAKAGPSQQLDENGDPDGCSPWSCRSGIPVEPAAGTATDPGTDREAA